MTELILIRHGETDWNRALRFQGHTDVPLNAMGLEQAHRLGDRLIGVRFQFPCHAIYCSDLIRARQTAEPVEAALGLQALFDAQLREQFFGVVEGMSVGEIKDRYPAEWNEWIGFDADYAMPGGETTRQFHARTINAMSRIAIEHPGESVVIVTHGGVLDMIYRTATSQGLEGARKSTIPNAGINRVSASVDSSGFAAFAIQDWADVAHLNDLPAQPVYDQTQVSKALIR